MGKTNATPKTSCAPVGRKPGNVIEFQRGRILVNKLLAPMLEAIPDCAMVLNREKQVLVANSRLITMFGLEKTAIIGRRPGEIICCIHAGDGPDGCNTGIHCTACDAALAVLESQENDVQTARECRITVGEGNPVCLDLHVMATPVVIADIPLTVCVMKDISAEKRRRVLEKVFFHDVLNTVNGISGVATLLADQKRLTDKEKTDFKQLLVELSEKLIDEIRSQRNLLAAEKGEFKPELGSIPVRELMREVHSLFANHEVAQGRNLVLGDIVERTILSDAAILRRILGNLVKNALEAVEPGQTVTLYCTEREDELTFHVHNPGVMPQEVQLQLFQRSFSTKGGEGRGIGTYSIKLFGEQYLKGKVAFTSSEPDGTIFSFTLFPNLPLY